MRQAVQNKSALLLGLTSVLTFIIAISCMPALYTALDWMSGDYGDHKITYTNVSTICRALMLRLDDPFCSSPGNQTTGSLEALFHRNFPIGVATFEDLIPFIAESDSYLQEMSSMHCTDSEYWLSYCPPPDQCIQDYSCYIYFGDTIGRLEIEISYTDGTIIGYEMSPGAY